MPGPNSRQVTRAWGILILLTSFGIAVSHSGLTEFAMNGLVLVAAFAKGRVMVMDFLKLRNVPRGWQSVFVTWLALVTSTPWIGTVLPMLLQ